MSTSQRSTRARFRHLHSVLLAVVALSLFGCHASPKQSVTTLPLAPNTSAQPQSAPSAPLFVDEESALVSARQAFSSLPAKTPFALAFGHPQETFARLGQPHLAGRHSALYQEATREMREELGLDLFNAKATHEVGIDSSRPAGIAVVTEGGSHPCFFFHINDFDKLRVHLERQTRQRYTETTLNAHHILQGPNDPKVFLRAPGDIVWVIGDSSSANPAELLQVARLLAEQDPERSLIAQPEYQAQAQRLRYGQDAAFFFNPTPLIQEQMAEIEQQLSAGAPDHIQQQRRDLEAAKANGDDPEVIRQLEEALRDEEAYAQRQQVEERALLRFMETVLLPVEALSMGGHAHGPSVGVMLDITMTPGSLLDRLLRPAQSPSPLLLTSHTIAPAMMWYAHAAPAPTLELVELMLESSGTDLKTLDQKFKLMSGLSLQADLLPLFSGEVGMSLSLNVSRKSSANSFNDLFSMTFTLGLTDADQARQRFDQLLKSPLLSALVKNPKALGGDSIELALPGIDKPFYVSLMDLQLVASFDAELIKHLDRPREGYTKALKNPDLASLLEEDAPEGIFSIALSLFSAMNTMWDQPMSSSNSNRPSKLDANDPHAALYDSHYKRYVALEAKLQGLESAARKGRAQAAKVLSDSIGAIAFAARRRPGGWQVKGGYFTDAPNLPHFIDQMVEYSKLDEANDALRDRVFDLNDKRWELERALDDMISGVAPQAPSSGSNP